MVKKELEKRVNEWRNRSALRQHQQNTEGNHDEHQWEQPEFLPHPQKRPYLANDGHVTLLKLVSHGFWSRPRRNSRDPVARGIAIEFKPQGIFAKKP